MTSHPLVQIGVLAVCNGLPAVENKSSREMLRSYSCQSENILLLNTVCFFFQSVYWPHGLECFFAWLKNYAHEHVFSCSTIIESIPGQTLLVNAYRLAIQPLSSLLTWVLLLWVCSALFLASAGPQQRRLARVWLPNSMPFLISCLTIPSILFLYFCLNINDLLPYNSINIVFLFPFEYK